MALLAPLVFAITRRYRIGPGRGWAPVIVHLGLSLMWIPVLASSWILRDQIETGGGLTELVTLIENSWVFAVMDVQWYVWIALAAHTYHGTRAALEHTQKLADLQVENAKLASRLSQAELDGLKAQLRPHFLFNTHNAIAGLIRTGRRTAALALLANLGDLLRYSLETKGDAEVRLERELGFARTYLSVQQIRFEGRLEVEWNVADECLGVRVPTLLLQPLVENAVHHGVTGGRRENYVDVSGCVENGYLELKISNSTVPETRDHSGFGVGLRNAHARLERLYGGEYALELDLVSSQEMQLHLRIPIARNK